MAEDRSKRLSLFAREMRREPTTAEAILWESLRASRLEGLKFCRQIPLGPYIVDFICFEKKLIVEADGGQHSESRNDQNRDAYFSVQGYRTIRFWNDNVVSDPAAVCAHILFEVFRN